MCLLVPSSLVMESFNDFMAYFHSFPCFPSPPLPPSLSFLPSLFHFPLSLFQLSCLDHASVKKVWTR